MHRVEITARRCVSCHNWRFESVAKTLFSRRRISRPFSLLQYFIVSLILHFQLVLIFAQ